MRDLSDTNAARIQRLDDSLARRGKAATLMRRIPSSPNFVQLPVRVRLSGYSVDTNASGVLATDSKFIMSPTPILKDDGAVWPGAAGGDKWPTVDDFLLVDGARRKIEQCLPIDVNGVVRIEGRVS
jgi:hypothetical protein